MAELTGDGGGESRVSVERLSNESGVTTFKVGGQLDVSTESVLGAALQQALRERPSKIVLDVSRLEFMDSSGLAVLLVAARQVDVLELRNPTDIIRRLVTIAGLNEALHVTPHA